MHILFKGKIKNNDNRVHYSVIAEIVNTTSEAGVTLVMFLLGHEQKAILSDKIIMSKLGWSLAKVKRIKKSLKDKGWIDYWTSKGNSYLYVGKDQVRMSLEDRKEAGVKSK